MTAITPACTGSVTTRSAASGTLPGIGHSSGVPHRMASTSGSHFNFRADGIAAAFLVFDAGAAGAGLVSGQRTGDGLRRGWFTKRTRRCFIEGRCRYTRNEGRSTMDALAEKLDGRLCEWKPETAAEARERITEVIELADHDILDIARSRAAEQEVLDLLDAPPTR